MATRPCKPGADVKGIWRLLLPEVPFPNCDADAATSDRMGDAERATDSGEAPAKPRAGRK
jgi:hypothetical protein